MLLFIVLPWYKGSQRKILTFVCVCISMGRYTYTYIHSKQEYCLKKGNSITNYCQVPVHICWYLLFVFKIPPVSSEDFPDSSVVKESACNAGDPGLIPGSGRSVGEGIHYQLQYSWASLVAQLVKNPPAMWETWFNPWVGEIPWRSERLPTPVFWPGEFHGLYSPWGHKESDTTERLSLSNFL